jgi:glycosyltransferase involved in cell wall biosynthesis
VRRYVNALNEQGLRCVIVCSKKKHEPYFGVWNGNRVYRIPVYKKRHSFILTFIEYWLFASVASVLLFYLGIKYRFRIIQVHTLPDYLVFAAWFNKLLGSKIILDLHEIFSELFIARKPHLANSFYVKLLKLGEKLSIKFANKVITIHEPAKDIFISRNKNIENKIQVIMNSVDPAEFKSTVLTPTEHFIIMYNGTIVKLLSLDLIIKSLAVLKKVMPERDFEKIKFRLFGEGPVLNDLLSLAKEKGLEGKVEYKGFVPPEVMHREVLKANVCILPPLKNIYSDLFYTIKLIEMVYLKIPVIATRLNTYKRYYREESLFYFDSGNVEQLAERITDVFYNPALVKEKTQNAFDDYIKVDRDVMMERYKELVKSLLYS